MPKFNRFAGGFCGCAVSGRGRFGRSAPVSGALIGLLALGLAACASQPRAPASTTSAPPSVAPIQTRPMAPVSDISKARSVAPELGLRRSAPLRYVVKKGDTLWAIAGYYLENPWQWPSLWYENPQIHNPHLIYPGDVLRLVWVHGHPRLATTTNVEHLEPQVRSEPLAQATPAIPFAAIRNFLNGPRLVDAAQIDGAPYVVAFRGEHLIGAASDGVFVKNLPSHAMHDWQIVHIGKTYRDPDTGELLGYEAIPAARVALVKAGRPALLKITSNDRETLIGDRLLKIAPASYEPDFVPHPPSHAVAGSIISVFNGIDQVGQHAIVTLDRGSDAGLDPGAVLQIMQPARTVPDPHGGPDDRVVLPPQPAGLMMVFEVTPRLSYALVMQITQAVHVLDHFVAPERSVR